MKIQHPKNGIIFCHNGSHKSSAVLFENNFILTSGLALLQAPSIGRDFENIPKHNVIDVRSNPDVRFLHQIDYRLVIQGDNDRLFETKVRIAYILNSTDIESTIKHSFNGLKFMLDGEYKDVTEYRKYFSTFVILQHEGQNSLSLENLQKYFKSMINGAFLDINLMEEIVCASTPFGNEHFINSINFGHVANLLGKDNCLALLNVTSAFGCEGGGVYDKFMNLRCILLGSCFAHQDDNVCFPLAANISEIFKILFGEKSLQNSPTKLTTMMNRSTCMIDAMGCWGTGCMFQLNERNFVLTCAHVLSSENITCYCHNFSFQPALIYKNPIFDRAYDIALLEDTERKLRQNKLAELTNYIPVVGQTVYSVGFPIFKNFSIDGIFKPSVYRGTVTNYSKGVLITDCPVQTGQSGGPIYDEKGNLLAVMVSNFKSTLDNRIYPHHNMCIPICDIYDILHQYSQNNDFNTLNQLQAERSIVNKWMLKSPMVESKL